METKTILELLQLIPDEAARARAIKNTPDILLEVKMKGNVWEALSEAFVWVNTQEGYRYWAAVYTKLKIS